MRILSATLRAAAALLLFAAAPVFAQTPNYTTSITAAAIKASGAPVPFATVCVYASDVYGNPISIAAPTFGLILQGTAAGCGSVVNGALTAPISVPDASHTNAAGPIYYNISIQQTNSAGTPIAQAIIFQHVPGITGASWALDAYVPSVTIPVPTSQLMTYGSSGLGATCTSPSIFLPATPGASPGFCQGGFVVAFPAGTVTTATAPRTNAAATDSIATSDCTVTGGFVSESYAGNVAVALPATNGFTNGCRVTVKNLSGNGYQLTLTPTTPTLIDGLASLGFDYPGDVTLSVDGSNWKVAGGNGVRGATALATPNGFPYVAHPGVVGELAPGTTNGTFIPSVTVAGGVAGTPALTPIASLGGTISPANVVNPTNTLAQAGPQAVQLQNAYETMAVDTTIGMMANFNSIGAWSSTATYANGAIVSYDGQTYTSLAGSNTGNTPPIPPATSAYWAIPAAWSATTTYAATSSGTVVAVSYNGVNYESLQANNLNNPPAPFPQTSAWWQVSRNYPVATQIRAMTQMDSTSDISGAGYACSLMKEYGFAGWILSSPGESPWNCAGQGGTIISTSGTPVISNGGTGPAYDYTVSDLGILYTFAPTSSVAYGQGGGYFLSNEAVVEYMAEPSAGTLTVQLKSSTTGTTTTVGTINAAASGQSLQVFTANVGLPDYYELILVNNSSANVRVYAPGQINTAMNGVIFEGLNRPGLGVADYTSTPSAITSAIDAFNNPTYISFHVDTNGLTDPVNCIYTSTPGVTGTFSQFWGTAWVNRWVSPAPARDIIIPSSYPTTTSAHTCALLQNQIFQQFALSNFKTYVDDWYNVRTEQNQLSNSWLTPADLAHLGPTGYIAQSLPTLKALGQENPWAGTEFRNVANQLIRTSSLCLTTGPWNSGLCNELTTPVAGGEATVLSAGGVHTYSDATNGLFFQFSGGSQSTNNFINYLRQGAAAAPGFIYSSSTPYTTGTSNSPITGTVFKERFCVNQGCTGSNYVLQNFSQISGGSVTVSSVSGSLYIEDGVASLWVINATGAVTLHVGGGFGGDVDFITTKFCQDATGSRVLAYNNGSFYGGAIVNPAANACTWQDWYVVGYTFYALGPGVDNLGNLWGPNGPIPVSLAPATSGSIGGSSLAAGACTSTTVGIPGLTTAMDVHATPGTYPGDGFWWGAYASAAGTATVKVCAFAAGTPAASTYNVRVSQ